MTDSDLISTAEAARLLGYKSRKSINYLITTGKLKAVRTGEEPRGRYVLRRADVEAYARKLPSAGRQKREEKE